ncbi:hypothetical protein [Sinomonas terrae]|uniref:Uncharacterized protein n=1 Tax=Sinomonas terrae TaxID=2908838 RepID=A0ABS9U3L2_9MICC|nr:hypothetical protein [Sinomonas terrae]MCH6471284.1 hypothetical protein [Sinomonas terrae]
MMAFTMAELAEERADMLPERDTLSTGININVAPVIAFNFALAVNAATINSTATANAGQWLALAQP